MAKLTTANNAVTVLDGDLSSSATTLVLTDISNFPVLVDVDDYCILTLIRASDGAIEYVKCTSQNVSNRSYEILRGQESTVALDLLNGDGVRNLLTADQIETLRTSSNDKLPLVGGTLAGNLDLGGNTIENVATAIDSDEAPNLQQVLDLINAIPSNNGTLLTSIDMTNGGADDLSNIDITWNSAWDAYDHVDIVIRDARNSGSGQMAWALSGDSGLTWDSPDGSTYEALGWSNTDFGGNTNQVFDARMRMVINSVKKITECIEYSAYLEGTNPNDSDNSKLGYLFRYNGTTLTDSAQGDRWDGWYTGSTGLDGYLLRLVHDAGTFTSGTLRLIGYNYPS